MGVRVVVIGSPASLSNSESPGNTKSCLGARGDTLSPFWAALCSPFIPLRHPAPCREASTSPTPTHPTPSHALLPRRPLGRLIVRQVPGSRFSNASAFSLSSPDENANLGTVMRYEEIGKPGWESRDIGSYLPPPRATWGRGEA